MAGPLKNSSGWAHNRLELVEAFLFVVWRGMSSARRLSAGGARRLIDPSAGWADTALTSAWSWSIRA